MAELITLAVDIALGLLAYRLAFENRKRIESLETRLENVMVRLAVMESRLDLATN